ncbi:UvrB/UvrC motif-containing protein [Candidatus Micrarchaeota archaeon]|nr:UvrB/UvrC motif-containing protein [Candidatus Micrarchaeota archaeon]
MDGKIIAAAALVLMFSAGFAFFGIGSLGESPHDGTGFMRGMHYQNESPALPMGDWGQMPRCDGQDCAPMMGPHGMGHKGNLTMGEPQEIPDECRQALESGEASSLLEEIRSAMEEQDFEFAKELREELIELMPDGCAFAQHSMPQKMNEQGREAPPIHGMSEECRQALESGEFSSLMGELHSALESGDTTLATELKEEIRELMPDGCAGFPLAHGIWGAHGCPFSEDEAS